MTIIVWGYPRPLRCDQPGCHFECWKWADMVRHALSHIAVKTQP